MQAARGTSLSDAGTSRTPRGSARAKAVLVAVAAAAYAVDVGSKVLAVQHLADGDREVVGTWFVLHLTRNPGAAFSTGIEFTVVLSVLAMVAVGVVVWLGRRVGTTGWAWAMGLLLGGVAGNLTDRLFREPGPMRGHVVDFLMVPNWPVFNVADICINVAAGLIILQTVRGITLDGTRVSPREKKA
ncbi:MAG: signal peptidase II [Nocardioides sp.]